MAWILPQYFDRSAGEPGSPATDAAAALPAVRLDSRLGWEPSMEYVCDEWHLDWKRRQMESTLREISQYREIIQKAYQTG